MKDCIGSRFIIDEIEKPVSEFDERLVNIGNPIYEVLRVEEGIPLFFEDYFNRLQNSISISNIKYNINREGILKTLYRLIKSNELKSGYIKLIFTVSKEGQHFIAYIMQAYKPEPEEYNTGVKSILLHEERPNPNAKVWNGSFRKKAKDYIEKSNAFEAILVNNDGNITEGSRSNIFFIKNDVVFTPPENIILPGITRKKVVDICFSIKQRVFIENISFINLNEYDSAFLTGTSRKIVPVKSIDNIEFEAGSDLLKKISRLYDNRVSEYINQNIQF